MEAIEKPDANNYDLTTIPGVLDWLSRSYEYWEWRAEQLEAEGTLGSHGRFEMRGARWAINQVFMAIKRQSETFYDQEEVE